MWSDRYHYLNIYYDESLACTYCTHELIDFLNTLPELKQSNFFTFTNGENFFLFIDLILLQAKNLNSWSDRDSNGQTTNLIAIVCSKSTDLNFQLLKRVFIKIASFLEWQLVEEQNDDGIENFVH